MKNIPVERNEFTIEENSHNLNLKNEEKWKKTIFEIVIPFFISGLGMVF